LYRFTKALTESLLKCLNRYWLRNIEVLAGTRKS